MLYIAAALFCEAKPIIEAACLKKDLTQEKFQLFRGESVLLIVTGSGPLKAAVAVTYLLGLYPPALGDFLINAGICGTDQPSIPFGTAFICNKISDAASGKDYYPDILFTHPFQENSLVTFPAPVYSRKQYALRTGYLADMEAAGIMEAVRLYFPPHRIAVLKIVSDHISEAEAIRLNPEDVSALVAPHAEPILRFRTLSGAASELPPFNSDETSLSTTIIHYLKLTAAMRIQLEQLMRFHKLTGHGLTATLRDFLSSAGQLPCNTRKERSFYFEQLKSRLTEPGLFPYLCGGSSLKPAGNNADSEAFPQLRADHDKKL